MIGHRLAIGYDCSVDGCARGDIDDLVHPSLKVNLPRVVVLAIEDPDEVVHAAHHLELEDAIQRVATSSFFADEDLIYIDVIALHGGLDGHRGIACRGLRKTSFNR